MPAASPSRLKAEVVILGEGCAALFAAARAVNQGFSTVLVNPLPGFLAWDIRPTDGLSLWNRAFRTTQGTTAPSLPHLWDELTDRLSEAMPASVDEAALERCEHWALLSSVPVHRVRTAAHEESYLRLERKPWSTGHVRLASPDYVDARMKAMGLYTAQVAALEGAVSRGFAINWDAPAICRRLSEFLHQKSIEGRCTVLTNAEITGRVGRRITLACGSDDITLEYGDACLIYLSGDLAPEVREILKGEESVPWLQALRKRRRERHFLWFAADSAPAAPTWLELGDLSMLWRGNTGVATWVSETGPDSLDHAVDECLRMTGGRVTRTARCFSLEWEWKTPQWRETSYGMHWATAFEGDLWGALELVWKSPA